MRTRRSWRNQDRLFRELFAQPPPPRPTLDQQITGLETAIAQCGNRRTRNQLQRDLMSLKRKRSLRR